MSATLREPDLMRTLTGEERRIVARLYYFLKGEYEYLRKLNPTGDLSPLSDIPKRTAEATGVLESKVMECVNEFEEFKNAKLFEPPKGKTAKEVKDEERSEQEVTS